MDLRIVEILKDLIQNKDYSNRVTNIDKVVVFKTVTINIKLT